MSTETKKRIEDVIKELDYTPRNSNRNFKIKSTKTIGLVIADITDSFYSMLCKGVTDASLFYDYHVLIANTDNNVLREKEYISSFLNITEGLIIGTVGNNDEFLCSLKDKTKIVLADRNVKTLTYDVITSNNYQAVHEMLRYLFTLGYESYGLFVEPLHTGMARTTRAKAFTDFMSENKLESSSSINIINIYDEKIMMRELMNFVEKIKQKKQL